MVYSLQRAIYHGLCALVALSIAASAILPVSAATANALSYRGGETCGGCHNVSTTCTGSSSCTNQKATACLTGENDTNRLNCGSDTGLCKNMGCDGADVTCGG
jgi:hypothetical protein